MNNESLVSVITPMYNAEKYILETIQSVIQQTYKNWEMIIVDNKSTDNSILIVKSVEDKRIKVVNLEYNSGGPARPRNIGIDNAKGEYIAFLDADDVWLPKKLEKQIRFLNKNKNVDICYTFANIIDEYSVEKNKIRKSKFKKLLDFFLSKKNVLYYINYVNINSVVMKVEKQLKFDEDENLVAVEDWKYWINSQNNGKIIHCLDEILLNYRVHDSSISQRNSDIVYRKSLYLLSLLMLKKEVTIKHFIFASLMNLGKIFTK